MLWVISRFIFPGSSSRGESRVLQPPRCSFLFSLLHFIPLGDFLPLYLSPLFSVLPHSRAQWIVIIMMALRWLSRPVLRGERENGPGDGGIPFCVFRRRPPSDPDLLTPFDMRYEPFSYLDIGRRSRANSPHRLKRLGGLRVLLNSIITALHSDQPFSI